jgi:hypothetical protein
MLDYKSFWGGRTGGFIAPLARKKLSKSVLLPFFPPGSTNWPQPLTDSAPNLADHNQGVQAAWRCETRLFLPKNSSCKLVIFIY